jgi:hypothetical protein
MNPNSKELASCSRAHLGAERTISKAFPNRVLMDAATRMGAATKIEAATRIEAAMRIEAVTKIATTDT